MSMSRMHWVFIGAVCLAGACVASERASDESDGTSSVSQAVTSDGPFASQQALVAYWTANAPANIATQIFLNGKLVFKQSGFGPADTQEYFACSAGNIYSVCPTGWSDGFWSFQTLASRIPAAAGVRKDGTLVRSPTPPVGQVYDVSTCTGQTSDFGTPRYFRVLSIENDFSPPYQAVCYPL
jgi:hypothetical protein